MGGAPLETVADGILDDPAFRKLGTDGSYVLFDEVVYRKRRDGETLAVTLAPRRAYTPEFAVERGPRPQHWIEWHSPLRPDIAELPHLTSARALTKRQRRRLRGRQL